MNRLSLRGLRALASGPWRYHGLLGYTSRGSGASIVAARLDCNLDITAHRLRCA